MGPILPLGFEGPGWLNRPGSVGGSDPTAPGADSAGLNVSMTSSTMSSTAISMNRSVSSVGINGNISQMLQAIGGGLENNKMLELMIALLIIMALLDQQQQQRGGSSALDALGQMGLGGWGGSSFVQFSSSSYSSVSIASQYSSISLTAAQTDSSAAVTQSDGADGSSDRRFDLLA